MHKLIFSFLLVVPTLGFAKKILSAPFRVVVSTATTAEANMPTWRQGQALSEWRQIPNSALSSAPIAVKTYPGLGNTGPSSKVGAWTGFGVDTRDSSIYSLANGGHSDYAGNEVDRIRLSDNAPAWTEPKASTPSAQVVANSEHYADGRPSSRHSYYGVVVNEQRNRAMVLAGAEFNNGYMLSSTDGFNLSTNDWDSANTYPNVPSTYSGMQGAALVEEKSTGDIYTIANFAVHKWSNSTNTWSEKVPSSSVYGQYAATAFDTKRNRILVAGGNVNDHGYYDVATNSVQNITFTGPESGSLTGSGNGMVYEPSLDVYLLRKQDSGGTIYRINAQTYYVDTLPTSAGAAIPAAPNGVWRRFLYLPKLKGIVFAPNYEGNLWFIRTSN